MFYIRGAWNNKFCIVDTDDCKVEWYTREDLNAMGFFENIPFATNAGVGNCSSTRESSVVRRLYRDLERGNDVSHFFEAYSIPSFDNRLCSTLGADVSILGIAKVLDYSQTEGFFVLYVNIYYNSFHSIAVLRVDDDGNINQAVLPSEWHVPKLYPCGSGRMFFNVAVVTAQLQDDTLYAYVDEILNGVRNTIFIELWSMHMIRQEGELKFKNFRR